MQDTFDGCSLLSEVSLRFFRHRSDGVEGKPLASVPYPRMV